MRELIKIPGGSHIRADRVQAIAEYAADPPNIPGLSVRYVRPDRVEIKFFDGESLVINCSSREHSMNIRDVIAEAVSSALESR